MRCFFLAAISGLIFFSAVGRPAVAQSQAVPDAPAPQPIQLQKAPETPAPQITPPDAAPVPAAQKVADPEQPFPFPGQDNAGTTQPSAKGAGPNAGQKPQPIPSSKDFPFPDDAGSEAATPKAASDGGVPDKPTGPPVNPNFSSSATLHDEGSSGTETPADPKRVKVDQGVAKYYWHLKDWEGAYLRYKDALRFGPENPDTLFGLAEAEAKLGKNLNARKHYEEYLHVAPDGPRAHDVVRAVANLPEKDAPQKKGMGPVVP
jgi:hypothetical protein